MARFVRFQDQNEPGLYLVHPQNETAPCDVEIIFVHGLMGKPTKTWQHPETGCVFFRDLLPQQMREQLPEGRARIWSYGYAADVGFQTSQIYDFALSLLQEVRDIQSGCGERRIIWVCHSLGGIVVKRALNEACGQSQYIDIFRATVGITFLGTPHQGSGTATIGQIAAGVAGAFVPGAQVLNRGLLRNLERNSTTLFETSNRFASICSNFKIYTFYESRPLMGTRVVVTRSSAVLNLPNETARELNANHQSICRFKDRSDHNWRPVLNSILGMVTMTVRPSRGPVPSRIPPLSGVGNQRQPQPPYPRSSVFQQHQHNSSPGSGFAPTPNPQPPAFQFHPSQAPASYTDQYYGHYAGSNIEWSAELPEMTRRPVPSPSPSVQSDPPRPPKVPLPGGPSDLPAPNSSGSSIKSAPAMIQPHLAVGQEHRERRPYPSFNISHAREAVSPVPFASSSTSAPQPAPSATQSPIPQPIPPINHIPTLQPTPSADSSPAPSSSSAPSSAPQNKAEEVPTNAEVGAMCDACLNNIYCSQNRFQCSECYDYDLCLSCFRSDRVSKSHKSSHAVRHILKTEVLKQDDFIPPHDDVNPEKSVDQVKTFITLEPDVNRPECELRWHFLHGTDSHLRYLAATTEPGHYAAHLTILTRLSGSLTQAGRDVLKKEGLGYLRIGLGTLKNKKQFFRSRYYEESFQSLVLEEGQMITKLLDSYWWTVIKLPGDGEPVNIHADCVFPVETPQDLGLIIQWSGIRAFASGNEATVSINVADVRLYDIRDFTEPLKVPPEQPPPPPATSAPTAKISTPAPRSEAEDEAEEDITAEELLSTLLQIQQSVEDARQRAQLEIAIKQRLKQQEEERQSAILSYMFAKALQKQAILEQERREQEEARRFLSLMGFDF